MKITWLGQAGLLFESNEGVRVMVGPYLSNSVVKYEPENERRQKIDTRFLEKNPDGFLRSNPLAHMTASAWIVNSRRNRVIMVYHKLYDSWSWTGGHADGDENLLNVAIKEAREETGAEHISPLSEEIYSLEILTVDGHEKKGEYVPSHLHMNVTYLLQADEEDELKICPDENSGVAWFSLEEALEKSTEPWFVERIYKKLNEKLKDFSR